MPNPVVGTAMAACSFGVAPSTLNFLPTSKVVIEGKPAGTIMDFAPGVNIPPFGMCNSLANPTVAAATAAALGVLTPMPCVPVTVAPWAPPAPKTMIGGKPALPATAMCNCAYGGVITISMPGTMKTQIN
ncbi:DUF4280 domain-containing protein [Nocardioides marinquilinus]|uniref:DUF4280 domain-containing protein n=1 Tax=Nocardioides marinquilinus TaxID=1210400 RepID=A0ABP9QAZ3_9ACTN